MTRKRAIASIINETQVNRSSGRSTRKRRTKLHCYCSKCNGNFVDLRTKVLHDLKEQQNSADSAFNKSTTNFDMNMIQENEPELESVTSHESQEHETADGSEFIFLP